MASNALTLGRAPPWSFHGGNFLSSASQGHGIVVPTKETGWLTTRTLARLVDPGNLNSGHLQDIYATRDDDFAAPSRAAKENPRDMPEVAMLDDDAY